MDNAGLFLRECLTASSSVRDGIFGRDRFYQLFFYLKPALTVCELKGLALQLTYGLDFLSIQAYRLWMEHPLRGNVNEREFRLQGGYLAPAVVPPPVSVIAVPSPQAIWVGDFDST